MKSKTMTQTKAGLETLVEFIRKDTCIQFNHCVVVADFSLIVETQT